MTSTNNSKHINIPTLKEVKFENLLSNQKLEMYSQVKKILKMEHMLFYPREPTVDS